MLDSAKNRYNEKTMEKYCSYISKWESSFISVSEEILFLGKLLSSEIFEPNIPNLYERLQQYSENLQELKNEKKTLENEVEKYKADISEKLEVNEGRKDSQSNELHLQLKKKMKVFLNKFSKLKLDIFNFTGNILKKSR